jgi:hypothetical protein
LAEACFESYDLFAEQGQLLFEALLTALEPFQFDPFLRVHARPFISARRSNPRRFAADPELRLRISSSEARGQRKTD